LLLLVRMVVVVPPERHPVISGIKQSAYYPGKDSYIRYRAVGTYPGKDFPVIFVIEQSAYYPGMKFPVISFIKPSKYYPCKDVLLTFYVKQPYIIHVRTFYLYPYQTVHILSR
jgi:hypothetical protein